MTTNNDELKKALEIVNKEIKRYTEYLEKIAEADENDPVLVEGETCNGYYCHIMADPKDAAKIMLQYNYPTWRTLGDETPTSMWRRLAELYGLDTVTSIDL